MVTEYATPRSIPILESIPRVLTSDFWLLITVMFCVKVNAIYFHNFRNEKNAPFTLDFSGVYFGPITGGVFVFFPKRIPRGTLFEVFSVTIRTGL
jgi:hypothetical protein